MVPAERTRRTYFYELWRAGTAGILETAGSTFLLAVAVKHFQAGSLAKAIVAGSGSLGLLLSPLVVAQVTLRGWSTGRAASRILAIGATSFLFAALLPTLPAYVIFSLVGMTTSAAIIPLLTHMYQENYPTHQRGRLFSRTVMVRIASAAAFSKLAGDALNEREDRFRWLLLIFGGALAFASFCLSRCPTTPIPPDEGGAHPLRALRFVREDALFRRTLICWMLMGFANLMMLPLRVEYLANPAYQQAASLGMIALLTGVIPNLARLVLSPVWGYLFDHMNFFALRITLNVGFAIGILTFFSSNTVSGLIIGAVVFGISNAGGDVAWSLWVTKFAPAGRVADYMSVHTFLTGVRGVAAPAVAFYAVGHVSPLILAMICGGLILAASALLIPEIKQARGARPAAALVEEVSE
jgi:MFS family permease